MRRGDSKLSAWTQRTAPGVAGLTPYEPGKPVEELERELGISGAVKLASNENPLGPCAGARDAIIGAVAGLGRYPDGGGYHLKAVLAERLAVAPSQLTLGNGSNDVLELLARTFVTPEDEVVFSEHAFIVYPIVTQAVGATAVVAKARNHGHDLDAMAAAVTDRTRMVFIANPNNPTGTWLNAKRLRSFIAALPAQVLVVVDEAYFEYVGLPDYPDCTTWLADFPNLVVTRTFSKAHGLAGVRMGYGVSQPDVAELLNRVRQPFNINSLALAAAEAALRDEEHIRRSVEINDHGLRQLILGIEQFGLEYIPSVANFVTIDVGRPAAGVYAALLKEGIIVRPVAGYGLPRHLRVTVGRERENRRFLKGLEKVLYGGGTE
ncbi:MAG: histidinol-phosphate transaminase [Gammaproteobacteria bacterium]|nr:histidinol-phosphate transaminase [Gammaproteobacteria bacterium]